MSGGKGGSASKFNDYYGTVVAALGWGPLDWIDAIICNGGYLYQGHLALTTDATDLTGSIADPSLLASGGYLKLYRGTSTQPADAALSGHPPYKDTILLVAANLYFGRETANAPNLQVIGGRLPRIETSIVASADNVSDDGQVNPIAALAEILTDERGCGLSLSQLDAASWLAAAHTAYLNKDACFCSPLFTQQTTVRDLVKQLLEPFNGYLRWNKSGLLTVGIYEWGVDPGGLTTLDAQHWTAKPRFAQGDWIDVPTEIMGTFTDRDYEHQANSVIVPNARAAQIRQLDDQRRVDFPHIMRASQVHRLCTEFNRRYGTAPSRATIRLRQPFISSVAVGDKIKVDTDPEPGGTGLSQLCRVERIEQDRTDEATVEVMTDALLPASVYQPTFPTPVIPTPTSPPMAHFLAVPLPISAFDYPPSVGIVATRPSAAISGVEVYMSDAHANPFDYIGNQVAFATRCQLTSSILSGATTIRLTELDGLSGPDAQIAANTPGGNATAAQNNTLLILLATLDVNGRIQLDGNGDPIMEFISVSDRAYVSGADFDYTVLRGRLGTNAAAWTSGAVAWVIPLVNLFEWRTDLLETLNGAVAYFRLVSYTQDAIDTTTPVPECSCNMPALKAPAAPSGLAAVVGTGKSVSLSWTANTEWYFSEYRIYRNTVNNPSTATLIAETPSNRFVDVGVAIGTTYYYWVSAVSTYEMESAKSSGVSATPIITGLYDSTPPSDPTASSKTAGGTYYGGDGTIFSYLTLSIPGLPSGAAYQEVLYKKNGGGGTWMIAAQLTNSGTATLRLDDLTPGVSYDVATVAYSAYDVPSNIITATSSPFTAPNKTSAPNLPSSVTPHTPSSTNPVQLATDGGYRLYSSLVTFVDSTDKDIAGYEFGISGTYGLAPSSAFTSVPVGAQKFQFNTTSLGAQYLWVRAYDSTGNVTAWSDTGYNMNAYVAIPSGDMVEQNSNNLNITGVKTGSGSSVRQVVAVYDTTIVPTLTGGALTEYFTVSLTNRGFTTKPDVGVIGCSSDANIKADYDWDNASNSSSVAYVRVTTLDGTNLPASPVRFNCQFTQYT